MYSTLSLAIMALAMCFLALPAESFWQVVPEGHVGVETFMGRRKETLLDPGFHLMNPLSKVDLHPIVVDVDTTGRFKCSTSDSQELETEILVYNKVRKEDLYDIIVNYGSGKDNFDTILGTKPAKAFFMEFCSQHTGLALKTEKYSELNEIVLFELQRYQTNRPELNGRSTNFQIMKVEFAIPKLSDEVERNNQKIVIEKTAAEAERHRQITELVKKETENKKELLEMDKQREAAEIKGKENLQTEETKAKISKIIFESNAINAKIEAESKSVVAKIDSESKANSRVNDAEAISKSNQIIAIGEKARLTPEFLESIRIGKFSCQNHWGEKVPTFLQLGSITDKDSSSVSNDPNIVSAAFMSSEASYESN
jgi:hypothetical protein